MPYRSQRPGWAAFVSLTLALGVVPLAAPPLAAATAGTLPPVRHIWVLDLENDPKSVLYDTLTNDPYLSQTLPSEGAFIPYFFGVGHNSLDNYIAQVSGQAPNPQTQQDCGQYAPMTATAVDTHGQLIGQGCEIPNHAPASAVTLGDQLSAAGLSWKGYMQDMGGNLSADGAVACAHPTAHVTVQGFPNPQGSGTSSNYVVKHNPFGYFDSIIDNDASCRQHVVPLDPDMRHDLRSVATTPNFSLIVPTVTWDGHDNSNGAEPDAFLRKYVPMITSSPAFRQDGMLVVTTDESQGADAIACCNEIPGPNSPEPGEGGTTGQGGGAGGGQVGAVVLSPFVRPGTMVLPANPPQTIPDGAGVACTPTSCVGPGFYNHYSLLRTVEDLFNLGSILGVPSSDGKGHLGFAGSYGTDYPGPGEFGCEVFTAYPSCQSGVSPPVTTGSPSPSPVGPRALSAVSAPQWSAPAVGATDLRALACPSADVCVAVGAVGTVLASADGGQTWASVPTGTATRLNGIACPSVTACLAVGDGGALVTLASGASGWAASLKGLATAGNLNGISCLDATRCVAVGYNTILSTSDAGVTWTAPSGLALPPLAPGSTPDLLDVSCASGTAGTLACYAVGSLLNKTPMTGGTNNPTSSENVFRSTNPFASGATWLGQEADDAANGGVNGAKNTTRLRGIACSDATHCVAVGESAALSTTTDGTTWNDQSPIVPRQAFTDSSGTNSQLPGTEIYNAVTCPANAPIVSCVAVGTRPTLGNNGLPLAGYRTVQASVMAAELGTPGTAASSACPAAPGSTCNTAILEQPGTYDQLNAVTCPAVDECIAVGDGGAIVRTGAAFPAASSPAWTGNLRDSSITWDAVAGVTDASLYGIACASSTDCASVGGGNPQLVASDAVYSATGRSPRTTRSVPKPAALASQSPAPPTDAGARLTSVSCPAAGQCLAVGTTGWIATLAAGAWTSRLVDPTGQTTVPNAQTQHVVPTEDLQAVSCAPASALAGDTCVAVGDHAALVTSSDGGSTWTVATPPITTATLDGIACPDAGACVAVGANGTILALDGSSGTWSATPVPSSTTELLSAVSCPTPSSCIVAGTNGTVLTLSRGVGGWSSTTGNSGVGDDLYGVSCASAAVCVAAGANGTVISTVNGAVAWTAIGTGTDVTFRSVSCPTVTSCYAAGDSGAVLSVTPPVTGTLHTALSLSPAQVSTDGGTTTATVTVTNNGSPDPNATVSLTRTGTGAIGTLTNNGDGTYTAQLTASPRVGVETVTAQATDGTLSANATAPLTDTLGVPATITLTVDPGSIQADGVTTTRATATVTDAHQNVVPGETVGFSSDGDVSISPASAATDASGVAVATITASKTVGKQSISATDSAHGLTTSQPLTLVQTSVAPTNVVASPADDQAVVSWTSATPASGDTLTDYVVTPSPAGSQAPVKVPAGTTSTNVPGLTNGTAYTFTVTAEFGSGKTATSSPSNSVIPFGEPSVPKPVTAVAGDHTADVTWGASDGNGSPLKGYTVTASPGGATIVASPDQTTAHFTGLTNGTSYTFTVTARNAAEAVTSAPSAAVVPKYGTALHVAAAQVAIIAGQIGTVHGTLTRDGLPLRGAHVTITVRPAGTTSYSAVASVVTGGFGQWSIAVQPTRNSTYRIGFAGDPADRAAAAATSLPVHAQVHLSSPRSGTTLPRGYLTLTATSRYAVAGTSAWVQFRRPDGTWAPLAFARVGRDGGLRWVTTLGRGTHWLRLYVAATATNAAASTKPFVLYAT